MTPQELKNSILQLAIQGKLVPQRPDEGTGEELYRKIQAEKQALIKAGKIKKEKPLPEISDDEKPFDIPESWRWVHFNDLLTVISGVSYNKNDVSTNGLRILRGGNIQDGKIILDESDVFLPSKYDDKDKRVQIHDIIIVASTGSKAVIGKAGYVREELDDTMIGAFLRICRPFIENTSEYIRYIFESQYYRKHIRDLSQGTNINNVKESYITELLVPLPPLAEQKRIVAKIEELLPLVDRYAEAWNRLEALNKRFPDDLKKSLFQLAIQGKLVPQLPDEGTGEELYRKIQAEKQALIKAGKIKKEKPLPEISDDEKPFDIPQSWRWVKVGNVLSISSGDGLTTSQMNMGGKYPVYGGNGITGYHDAYNVSKETLVIGRVGFYCGSTHITEKYAWVTDNAFISTFSEDKIYMKWLKCCVDFLEPRKKASSTAQPVISGKLLYPMLIPLPPLAEQKRIVAKLEEILPLCERLK